MPRKIIFLIIIQFISLFGTHLSDFALSLYLYEQSHSISLYSYFSMMIVLPEIILAPIIGHYVDRFNKKWLMLIGHGGAGVSSLIILLLLKQDYQNFYIYLLLVMVGSFFNAMVFASFHVIIGYEVPKNSIEKASSIIELGFGLIMILSPAIGAYLLDNRGIFTIFYIDIATFSLALIIISQLSFKKATQKKEENNKNFFDTLKDNFIYIKSNKLLWLSLTLFALIQFNMAQTTVLITPVILSISTKTVLGGIISLSGVGMLIASILLLKIKINRSLYWINRFAMLQAIILFLAILHVNIIHIAIGSFLFMFFSSLLNITNYAYWQKEIDNERKGQLFAMRNSIMMFSLMMGYLLSAPLVEVSKIALEHYSTLYSFIGTYLKPEIRLLFIFNGVVILVVSLIIEWQRVKILSHKR
ncbi:MAG: MFS transporter [Epsilonproteobacteria bacterium]|nr:MFS transporter [Campylobacterota bacterium]